MVEVNIYIPSDIKDVRYKTENSVGYDICSIEKVKIPPKTSKLVDTGVIVRINGKSIFPAVFLRSSIPIKKKLILLNSVGIIDLDYCGKEDTIKLNLYNFGEETVVVEKGERIAQIVFLRFEKPELKEVSNICFFNERSRGGFGSTNS